MINLLSPLAYRVLPWKNGGGTTTEIATYPENAGWDDFLWRVGIADVAQSGPFSTFGGVDRSIMLLDCPHGSGMNLSIDGRTVDLVEHEFIDFAGEAVTHGVLRGDPVRDFNIMGRRGAIRYRRGWKAVAPREWFRLGGTDWRVVHVHSGAAELAGAASLGSVAAGETVIVSGEDELNLRGSAAGARLVWAVFTAIP